MHVFFVSVLGKNRKRKKLKLEAVPSVFPWKSSKPTRTRRSKTSSNGLMGASPSSSIIPVITDETDIQTVVIEATPTEQASLEDMFVIVTPKADIGIQCSLLTNAYYRLENFDDDKIKYLTGFQSGSHLQFLFNCLQPGINHLRYQMKGLNMPNQLFMTLIWLRHNKDYTELAINFNIDRKVVSKVIEQMIHFLYYELSEIDVWLSRDIVDTYFPISFQQHYPLTRVILDATEIPIDKPTECNSQSATFSTYKNRNTLKVLVGISPRGQVTFLSDVYGGSASDRQIVERSSLVNNGTFNSQDQIMADRGIMVQDLVSALNVYMNTPTTMKGVSQLASDTVIRDRKIASKRIHVERVIGYAKTFKILSHLSTNSISLSKKIIHICLLLVNFRDCIVSKDA